MTGWTFHPGLLVPQTCGAPNNSVTYLIAAADGTPVSTARFAAGCKPRKGPRSVPISLAAAAHAVLRLFGRRPYRR